MLCTTFSLCQELETVDFPETTIEIGLEAFEECSSLSKIRIPHNVKKLGMHTFFKCHKLKNVFLPNGIIVDPSAFNQCENVNIQKYE